MLLSVYYDDIPQGHTFKFSTAQDFISQNLTFIWNILLELLYTYLFVMS